jgi:archaetidylinositol phosphate synthase
MMSPRIEFCEPGNPGVLDEVHRSRFQTAERIQSSLLSKAEKCTLNWLAERMPKCINPDHLTLLGFGAQLMAGVSYALARQDSTWLLMGIGFLGLNWFGDSLDGTVARFRHQQRPRYGFYVDHMVDSFGALALTGGLALSGYMQPRIAGGLLLGFLLLSIQSYLATYTLGEFRLSFWRFGPTELRILLAIGNLALLRWPVVLRGRYPLFDLGGLVGLAGMFLILLFFTFVNLRRLYREDRLP